jgi:hypothetical protein
LYTFITRIKDNDFTNGMECSVAREIMGGPGGAIVIIVEAI